MTNETNKYSDNLNFVKKVFFAGFKAGVAVSILFYLTYLALSRS
jgi:hypothetical protein